MTPSLPPFLLLLLLLLAQPPASAGLHLNWGSLQLDRAVAGAIAGDSHSAWHDRINLRAAAATAAATATAAASTTAAAAATATATAGCRLASVVHFPPPPVTPQALLAVPRRARALCELFVRADLQRDCSATLAAMLRAGRSSLHVFVSMLVEEQFTVHGGPASVSESETHHISVCAVDQATLDMELDTELAAAGKRVGFENGNADRRNGQLRDHLTRLAADLSSMRQAALRSASVIAALPMFCTRHAPYHICVDASTPETPSEAVRGFIAEHGARVGTPMEARVSSFMTFKYLASRLGASLKTDQPAGTGPVSARDTTRYALAGSACLLLILTFVFCTMGGIDTETGADIVNNAGAQQRGGTGTSPRTPDHADGADEGAAGSENVMVESWRNLSRPMERPPLPRSPPPSLMDVAWGPVDLLKGVATCGVIVSHSPLVQWFYPGTSYAVVHPTTLIGGGGGGDGGGFGFGFGFGFTEQMDANTTSSPMLPVSSTTAPPQPWLLANGGLVVLPFSILSNTRHAVHLFFFLTGFANMLPLVATAHTPSRPSTRPPTATVPVFATPCSVAAFYARRLYRMRPLLVVAGYKILKIDHWDATNVRGPTELASSVLLLFTFSFTLWPKTFGRFDELWSLGVTMNFVLVFPVLVLVHRRLFKTQQAAAPRGAPPGLLQAVLLVGLLVLFLSARLPSVYPPFLVEEGSWGGFQVGSSTELDFRIPHIVFGKDSIYGSCDDFLVGMVLACWFARGQGRARVKRPWCGVVVGVAWLQLGCTAMDLVQLGALPLGVCALVPNTYHVGFTLILASLLSGNMAALRKAKATTSRRWGSRWGSGGSDSDSDSGSGSGSGSDSGSGSWSLVLQNSVSCGCSALASMLRFLGQRSYSIYLFQRWFTPLMEEHPESEAESTWEYLVRMVVVSALLVLFCACIEAKTREKKKAYVYSTWW